MRQPDEPEAPDHGPGSGPDFASYPGFFLKFTAELINWVGIPYGALLLRLPTPFDPATLPAGLAEEFQYFSKMLRWLFLVRTAILIDQQRLRVKAESQAVDIQPLCARLLEVFERVVGVRPAYDDPEYAARYPTPTAASALRTSLAPALPPVRDSFHIDDVFTGLELGFPYLFNTESCAFSTDWDADHCFVMLQWQGRSDLSGLRYEVSLFDTVSSPFVFKYTIQTMALCLASRMARISGGDLAITIVEYEPPLTQLTIKLTLLRADSQLSTPAPQP